MPRQRRLNLEDGSYTMYQPSRGLGINRNTYNTVSSLSRAAKPYAMSLYKKASSYLSSGRTKRQQRIGDRRPPSTSSSVGVQLPAGGGSESKSYFTMVKKNKSVMGKMPFSRSSLNRSNGFSKAATQGLQTATNLGAMFNDTDIVNIFTAAGQTATGQNSAKVYLESAHAKALITNAETSNVHFTIYDLMCRLDGGALNTDPASTFLAGNVDAVGGASADATIPGTTPFSNPRFVEAYKVLKQTPIILAPGQCHTHYTHYAPNRLVSNERQVISGVGAGPIAGLTVWSMIVQHGTPVHGVAALTSVTIGASKLDIVLLEEIRWKIGLYNYPINSITTTLVTNLTGEQIFEQTDAEVLDAAP